MAQPHGTTVPDGLEPVPQDRFPEFIPPYNEKQVSPDQKSPPAAVGTATGEKTIFGLRRPTFFLLLLLILVIIIAAVAGGVGGSVAVNNAYDRGKADAAAEGLTDGESSTIDDGTEDNDNDEATESSERVQPPPTKGVLALDCPNLTDTIESLRIGAKTYKFRITCGINHSGASGAEDVMILPAYSLDDCMRACATLNDMDAIDKGCVTAHFNAHILTTPSGNCWLKSKVGKSTENKDEEKKDLQVEAELLED